MGGGTGEGGLASAAFAAPAPLDWDSLDAALRPRFIALGVRRFRLGREECEDAVQAAFMNALAQESRIRDPIAYLKVSFLNACRTLLASRGRMLPSDPEVDTPDAHAGAHGMRVEAACAISGAFRRIEPRCRALIEAYYLEDRPLAETAERNGYSQKTVWKRINRCLEKMRMCLR
jgi:RNA polymerase sigma factor (sigma-70 family)